MPTIPLSLIERLGARGTANALRELPSVALPGAQAGMSTPKVLGAIGTVGLGGYGLVKALRDKKPDAPPPPRVSSEETRTEKKLKEIEEGEGN